MPDAKRILFMSDTHCGHRAGLTPPYKQEQFVHVPDGDNSIEAKQQREQNRRANTQKDCWIWFCKHIDLVNDQKKIDLCVINGDLVDGPGRRSGGTECLTTDMNEQCDMAVQVAKRTGADKFYITYGTPYHTGEDTDYELVIANRLDAEVHSHLWLDVNGHVFDIKHEVKSSGVPHGRHTAPARARVWNILWAEDDRQPKAHTFIRSHVHYFGFCGGKGWQAFTLPALQAAHTKYGARRCEGKVDYGFLVVDVDEKGAISWTPYLAELEVDRATKVKV